MKTALRKVIALILVFPAFCWQTAHGEEQHAPASNVHARAPRLISLAPSNTELIYSLNAEDELLGVSDACNFPPQTKSKAKVGSFNSIKLEKIKQLHPDKVLLISGQEALAETLKKHNIKVEILENSSIERIPLNIRKLGEITKHQAEASKLADEFTEKMNSLKALTQSTKQRPRVLICVWPQPIMAAGKGSFMDQAITICGGINCTGDLAQPYPRVNPERLLLLKPDIILLPNEVRNDKFWLNPPWKYMKAVKEKNLQVLPQTETDCLYRPTIRILSALYWLALTLHPELKPSLEKWKS